MSETFTRVDATFTNEAGQTISRVTLFAKTEPYRHQLCRFLDYGWNIQETRVDVTELTPRERTDLIGPIWPLLPLEEIVALVREPPGPPDATFELGPEALNNHRRSLGNGN